MAKIHLELLYKTDAILKVYLKDINGSAVTGATGTYSLVDAGDNVLQSGSMSAQGSGWYYFSIPNDISVDPGDVLLAKVTMISGTYQAYGEYEIFVATDRR